MFGRGIDIERINLAINYDLPGDADSYLHRVGRAGRFGTKGLSISFVSSEADRITEQHPELKNEREAAGFSPFFATALREGDSVDEAYAEYAHMRDSIRGQAASRKSGPAGACTRTRSSG